jgi:hypothetical protein
MDPVGTSCPSCRSRRFTLLNETTGLVACDECHKESIDPRLIKADNKEVEYSQSTKRGLFSETVVVTAYVSTHGLSSTGNKVSNTTTYTSESVRSKTPSIRKLALAAGCVVLGVILVTVLFNVISTLLN